MPIYIIVSVQLTRILQSVGCDDLLGSDKKWDKCGICGGDNSSCRVVEGSYNKPRLPYGYSLLLTLPTGASNVTVAQAAPSANHLGERFSCRIEFFWRNLFKVQYLLNILQKSSK